MDTARTSWRNAFTRGAAVTAIVLVCHALGLFQAFDLKFIDAAFVVRGPLPPASSVVIVTIDEESFDTLEETWPWPRARHGELLRRIGAQKPLAVGVDIAFPEASPYGEDDDRALRDALATTSNVVLAAPMTWSEQKDYVKEDLNPPSLSVLAPSTRFALVNLLTEGDAFIRFAASHHVRGGETLPTFAAALCDLAASAGVAVPPFPPGRFLIDFRGPPGTFASVPYARVLQGEIAPDLFTDKIVLVGATSPLLHDLFPTSFAPGGDMSGVEIQANTIDTLLRGAAMREAPLAVLASFILAVLAALLAVGGGAQRAILLVVLGTSGILAAGYALFVYAALVIEAVPLVIAWMLSIALSTLETLVREQRQRATLMRLFSQHVAPEVAAAIWEQRDALLDGGRIRPQKTVATVLFTDLKGFTGIAERMDTPGLLDWINEYMEVMAGLVMAHGGVVDDYYGDAIKANFGVPVVDDSAAVVTNNARRAVECALAMGEALEGLLIGWRARGLPLVGMRVGICTGDVVAGCVGSRKRLKFTTMGDTVNTAARLESFDKSFAAPDVDGTACRILIAESTHARVGAEFDVAAVGELALRGRSVPSVVYHVRGRGQNPASNAQAG